MSTTKQPKYGPPSRFGEWLRQLRTQKKLMLMNVADAGKMDHSHLSKAELGERILTEEQTVRLAKLFRVSEREAKVRRFAEKLRWEMKDEADIGREALLLLAEELKSAPAGQKKRSGAKR